MMKAVVVETKDGYAALLQNDGCVVKVKNEQYRVGDVMSIKPPRMRKQGRFSAFMATAAMFIILIGAGWLYATPYYYVSLDVNPSILMEVNMFKRVIGMEAANEDAVAVLEKLHLQNKNIEDALSEAVGQIAEAGYLNAENGNILIASAAKNSDKARELAEELRQTAENKCEEKGITPDVASETLGYNMVQQAKELGITPGKYNIITNLLGEEIGDNVNESIKTLMARFTASKGAKGKERANQAKENAQKNGKPEAPVNQPDPQDEHREAAEEYKPNVPVRPTVPELSEEPDVPESDDPDVEEPEDPDEPELEDPEVPVIPGLPDESELPDSDKL